jgi:hypothetical protein
VARGGDPRIHAGRYRVLVEVGAVEVDAALDPSVFDD